jgi:hypothetical protein
MLSLPAREKTKKPARTTTRSKEATMRTFKHAAALALSMVTMQIAQAVPVHFDESVHGDIESFFNAPQIFNFDVGANQISGNVGASPSRVDFDVFRFVIPEFSQLDSVTLELGPYDSEGDLTAFGSNYLIWTNYYGPNTQLVQSTEQLHGTFYNVLNTTGPLQLFSVFPLGPGAYDWSHALIRQGFADPGSASAFWDYRLTFSLSGTAPEVSVPEPGTLGLMLTSGLILAVMRRRKLLAS